MNRFAKTFTLSACALAASLLISACGGGTAGDTIAPTAVITTAASTVAGNTTFTFVFSESVGNSFSVEDLVVTGGTPSNFTKVSATTYTVDVTPTTAGAAVTVSLAAGKVFDLANNPNAVAASKTYDPNAIVGTGNTGACVTTSTVNCFGFEDTSVLFQAFEGLASAGTVVDPAGGTNKVLQLVKVPLVGTAGSQPWAGVTLHTSAVAPFTSPAIAFASSKVITMRVLSPAAGKPITLKVENSANAGLNMLKTVNTTKAHEWETLTFDFATPTQSSGVANAFVANTTFDVISLFPDFMTAETASVSYYFDELTYAIGAGGGAATGPATAAATPTALAANVLSVYSDAYTPITGVNLNPGWGQTTAVTEVLVAGNKTEKYATLNYQGIDFVGNAINVSAMSKLHIDVWTPDVTSIKVSLIATTMTGTPKENAVTLTPTLSGWNSFDIDLAGYTAPDKTKIDQIKIEGTSATAGGGTLYFDNLYFWKAPAVVGCGTTVPTCAPTTTIPTGAVTIYSDAVVAPGFNPFPNWGQSVTEAEVTIAGNKSLRYTFPGGGFGAAGAYEGLEWTAVNVSATGKLHLDLWSADISSLKVSLISAGKENAYTQAITAGNWNSVDIDLSNYTVADKTAIIQIKLESAGAGTLYVDNIHFWGTPTAGTGGTGGTPNPTAAAGSAGPVTIPLLTAAYLGDLGAVGNAVFAADYVGGLDALGNHATWPTAVTRGLASNGNIGYFQDGLLSGPSQSAQKLEENGWVAGLIDNAAGVPSLFRYFILTAPASTFASSYMGLYVNAPNNGTVDVSTYGSIKFRLWGPAEMYQDVTFSPTLEMKLTGPKVAGCAATGSGATEIKKTFVADQKIGAASTYKLSLAGWTPVGVCGTDTTATAVASVLAKLAQVVVTVPGSSFNFTHPNVGGTVTTYATGVNLGPIVFTAN